MKLPAPWSGTSAIAAWMRQIRSYVQSETFLGGRGFRKVPTPTGWYLEAVETPGGGGKNTTVNLAFQRLIVTAFGNALTPTRLPNLLVCRTWDGTNIGNTDIYVAKCLNMRQVGKEFFYDNGDNITQTYTYFVPSANDPSYGDNFRNANDGTNTELQVVDPRYVTRQMLLDKSVQVDQALIYAVDTKVPTGVKDPTGADVTLLETQVERKWSRYFKQ